MNIHALRSSERALHALDLARRIEAGELTPAAVLESCEQAIAAREAEIGAFAALDLPRAKQSAAIAPAGPLRGLPVGIKDIFDTVDFPTEYGSSIYAGHRPRTDAALVSQIRRAGGLLLGKTVTTEFAHMQPAKTTGSTNPELIHNRRRRIRVMFISGLDIRKFIIYLVAAGFSLRIHDRLPPAG